MSRLNGWFFIGAFIGSAAGSSALWFALGMCSLSSGLLIDQTAAAACGALVLGYAVQRARGGAR